MLQMLIGLLTGKAGEQVGGLVAKGAELVAIAGVVGGAVVWLKSNGGDVFAVVTYSDLALYALTVGPLVYLLVRLVHRAPPPG